MKGQQIQIEYHHTISDATRTSLSVWNFVGIRTIGLST